MSTKSLKKIFQTTANKCSNSWCKRLADDPKYKRCTECRASVRRAQRSRFVSGLCESCPNKRDKLSKKCPSCKELDRIYARAYYARKKRANVG